MPAGKVKNFFRISRARFLAPIPPRLYGPSLVRHICRSGSSHVAFGRTGPRNIYANILHRGRCSPFPLPAF